jgi:carbonic anhydrase/acetyltransferase-like protein (isoleucine patch superfamily)
LASQDRLIVTIIPHSQRITAWLARNAYIAPFLDHHPEIDDSAYIAQTAAVVGAVRIGKNSTIWHQVTLRGDNNFITIGEGTNIQDNSCVHINSRDYPTIIGNHVNIGHCALVHACHLHDHAFVGMGSIVMDGAVIESDSMLGRRGDADTAQTNPVRRIMGWASSPQNARSNRR